MTLDATLLSILACPEDKGPLWHIASEGILYSPRTHRSFPVIDGIPVMLEEEARPLADEELA